MSLVPLSDYYSVVVTVAEGGVSGLSLGALLILGQSAVLTAEPEAIASPAAWVTEGGTTTDEEYLALVAAHAQQPKASSILVADVGNFTNGVARVEFAADFQAGGTVNITYTYTNAAGDTVTESVSVAFSSSHGGTITAVDAALEALAGTVSVASTDTAPGARFDLTIDQTLSRTGTVTFTVTTVTGTGAQTGTGATQTAARTLTDALNDIAAFSEDFYGIVMAPWQATDAERKMDGYRLAAWATSSSVPHVVAVATDDTAITAGTAGNLAKIFEAAAYDRAQCLYHHSNDQCLDAAALSRWFGVNPDVQSYIQQGMVLAGITASTLTTAQRSTLRGDKCGFYGATARSGSKLLDAKMGSGRFPDVQMTLDWTKTRIEEEIAALFNRLSRTNRKLTYTDISAQALASCIDAVYARGVAAQHYVASRVHPTTGETVPGITKTVGLVSDQSTANREARLYTGLSAVIWLAGAMHAVEVNIVLEV